VRVSSFSYLDIRFCSVLVTASVDNHMLNYNKSSTFWLPIDTAHNIFTALHSCVEMIEKRKWNLLVLIL
jgi:hypothetical protein